jgi:hypothetical protein
VRRGLSWRRAVVEALWHDRHAGSPLARLVTRGYHLYALPAMSNRVRVALDWAFQTLLPPDETLASAQATAIYAPAECGRRQPAG